MSRLVPMFSRLTSLFQLYALLLCTALMLVACGGGGAGSSGEGASSQNPTPQSDGWALSSVVGKGHITLYWSGQAGAQSYEVWTQPVLSSGAASVVLSRSFDASIMPWQNFAANQWVHTVTELDTTRSHRVWVRARLASGSSSDSQIKEHSVVTFPSLGLGDSARFMPATFTGPVLVVDTLGGVPITDRENYRTATYFLYADGAARDAAVSLASGTLELRGRGNSSWDRHAKKSYRLRLSSAAALLSMPANRHWALIANHADKTLLRNSFAFEVSRRMDMAWTPRNRSVEVMLNGQYLGAFDLTEHIRTGNSRVNIAVADSDISTNVTGGYLLEIDRNDGEQTFTSARCALAVHTQSPDAPTAAQTSYLAGAFNAAESALYSGSFTDAAIGYAAHLDVDSFVDWYLHSELMHHIDAFRFSTFMVKERNGKFRMGPVWDFDLAMGNFDGYFSERPGRADTDGSASQRCWYSRLLTDPAFEQRVRIRWQQLRAGVLSDFSSWLLTQSQAQRQSHANNFQRWQVLDKPTWPNVVVTGSYGGEMEYLQWWLERRLRWMDSRWRF